MDGFGSFLCHKMFTYNSKNDGILIRYFYVPGNMSEKYCYGGKRYG